MSKSNSESSDDFEYVETPAAPTPVPPAEDFGVRTTAVRIISQQHRSNILLGLISASTQLSKMLPYQPMPLAVTTSPILSLLL